MTLNYLSLIVVDPTKLTKKYLDEISSPLSPEDGWIIFAVLLHQVFRKFSSDAHYSLSLLRKPEYLWLASTTKTQNETS